MTKGLGDSQILNTLAEQDASNALEVVKCSMKLLTLRTCNHSISWALDADTIERRVFGGPCFRWPRPAGMIGLYYIPQFKRFFNVDLGDSLKDSKDFVEHWCRLLSEHGFPVMVKQLYPSQTIEQGAEVCWGPKKRGIYTHSPEELEMLLRGMYAVVQHHCYDVKGDWGVRKGD
jgi:hypothetical protein